MNLDLNKQDISILEILQKDASKTSTEIAELLNMSQSPCWRKINRIEQAGYIQKRVAVLDREKLSMELVAFTTIHLTAKGRQNLGKFEDELTAFDEVVECYTMAGTWDYMLKIIAKDVRHYETFVRQQLLKLSVIGEIHSHIAVTEIKNSPELPLRTQL